MTISKAFEKSIKTPDVNFPLSKFWEILGVNCNIASSVELFIEKTKLIYVKEIVIDEIFIQTITHNTFKYFGKKTGRIEIGR